MKSEGLKRSQKQEKRVAKAVGGKVNPQSGAGWSKKNDVRAPRLLVEAKCKAKPGAKSITIKAEDLLDAEINALADSRVGVLTFELLGRDYYILTSEDFAETRLIFEEGGGCGHGSTQRRRGS